MATTVANGVHSSENITAIPSDIMEDIFPDAKKILPKVPKTIGISLKDQKSPAKPVAVELDEEELLLQTNTSRNKSRSSRTVKERPLEALSFSSRRIPRYFKNPYPTGAGALKRLKRMMSDADISTLLSIQSLYDTREDVFLENMMIECDLACQERPSTAQLLSSRLRSLSKSTLLAAQHLNEPIALKRTILRSEQKWKQLDPLNVLVGGFYVRSPESLSPLEYRSMAGRLQHMLFDCAGDFSSALANLCPEQEFDRLDPHQDEECAFLKLEDTGQQIFRQMTQYMNFVASSRSSTQKSKTAPLNEKNDAHKKDIQVPENSSQTTKTLFPIATRQTPKRDVHKVDGKSITEFESYRDNTVQSKAGSSFLSDKSMGGGKEDGELTDNADMAESGTDGENKTEGGALQDAQADESDDVAGSDQDSENGSMKKKKKKRKKSKSCSEKKEHKKKKKEKKSRDRDRSPDDLPKAYKTYPEQTPMYRTQMRDGRGMYQQRQGFHHYHQQRGGGNFRNMRFRGARGGMRGNFRPYGQRGMGNMHNRQYNSNQRGRTHYGTIHEKRFVSESSSDGERRYSRDSKRPKYSSSRVSKTPDKSMNTQSQRPVENAATSQDRGGPIEQPDVSIVEIQ